MYDLNNLDDEAGRFDNMYDVFGAEDAEPRPQAPAAPMTANVIHATPVPTTNTTPYTTSTVTTPPTASATPGPGSVPVHVTPVGTPSNDVNPSDAPASSPESSTDETEQSVAPRRGPARWLAVGVVAGLAFGAIQGGVVSITAITGVQTVEAVAPQMLTAAGAQHDATGVNDTPKENINTVPVAVVSLLESQLVNARQYAQRAGSYSGWRPSTPVIGAAGGPFAVVAVVVDGFCYTSGIAPGSTSDVHVDTTGIRCSIASVNELQVKIDSIG